MFKGLVSAVDLMESQSLFRETAAGRNNREQKFVLKLTGTGFILKDLTGCVVFYFGRLDSVVSCLSVCGEAARAAQLFKPQTV